VANLSINGQTLEKTAEKTDWIAGAISQEYSFRDCWIEFKFPISKYALMGLSVYNTSLGFASINFGIYSHINGSAYIYENGVRITYPGTSTNVTTPYTANDVFRVERKNGVIYYKKNGTLFYTSLVSSNSPLYADCAFLQHRAAITVTGYMFGLVWTGAANSDWNDPANWNLNRIPALEDQVVVNACSICPKLNDPVAIGALQLNNGSKIDIGGYTLTVEMASSISGSSVESSEGKIVSADFVEVKNSEFKGSVVLEKTGGSANTCYGGNTFSPALKFVNTSTNAWQVASQDDNVIIKVN
jgi:hypothetical protein